MKNPSYSLCSLLILLITMLITSSCSLRRPAAANTTIEYIRDKPSEAKLTKGDFDKAFIKILKNRQADLPFPELIQNFYEKHAYEPVLIPRFLPKNQIQILENYLMNSQDHGLDTLLFSLARLKKQLAEMDNHKSANALEVYRSVIELELSVTEDLIRYSMALQYGITNPFEIYKKYSTPTERPDSNFVMKIFEIHDLKKYLDSIQPHSRAYQALQKALIETRRDSSVKQEETSKTLIVNMERLRWKNKPATQKYVSVNIAGYFVDVMENEKSFLHIKVCVGEKGDHETPQLGSQIHSVQVNPVWNIPQSIAQNETIKFAANDKFYLANNNINVYKKGKLIKDPEMIDWLTADVNTYSFQQQPGIENALGKIKFLFNNDNSVYLHDTPLKSAFDKKMRAISHGCVRVEKPLELAYALFGKSEQYQQIKKAMQNGYPRAKFIALNTQIPIRLEYFTAWINNAGLLQYSNDVYELDDITYKAIKENADGRAQNKMIKIE